MYKRILLPLDGSVQAKQALPHAIAQAERFGAELVLLEVLAPSPGVHGLEKRSREWVSRYKASQALENLQDAATDAEQRDVPVKVSIAEGHAPTKIVEFAEKNDVDLIVMSTRGRSGLSRWLVGSVADRVVRGAKVPVLLVRAKNGDKLEEKRGEQDGL